MVSISRRAWRAAVLAVPLAGLALAGAAQAADKPFVDRTTPTNGATGIDPITSPTAHVVFPDGSPGIDAATLTPANVLVQPVDPVTKAVGSPVAASVTLDASRATITINPTACLALGTKYKLTLQ